MSDDLTITANNQTLGGWQAVRLTRGCERMPSDFDIAFTERYPGDLGGVVIKPGDECQVWIGGDLVLTGYVDRYMPSLTAREHIVRIQGRSKCEDLVDCSAGITPDDKSTGMQFTTTSLLDLAKQLAAPFGITASSLTGNSVPVAAPGGGAVQFNYVLTETPFEIIERVARYAGVLAYDGTDGNLILARAGATQMASGFAQGTNVQAASATFAADGRYSIYQPTLMSVDMFHDFGAGVFPYPPVLDKGVTRFRPLIVVSEQPQNGISIAKQRAEWEAARRRGRSQAVRLTCDSWRDRAGNLWAPNALAAIDLPALKPTPSDSWVISEVTFLRDQDRGTAADVTLMPKEAFLPEPVILQLFDWQIANALRGGAGVPGGAPT